MIDGASVVVLVILTFVYIKCLRRRDLVMFIAILGYVFVYVYLVGIHNSIYRYELELYKLSVTYDKDHYHPIIMD